MDIFILDKNLNVIDLIDTFKSFIWTDRFSECGDFELVSDPDGGLLFKIQNGYYLDINDSEHTMIVEDIKLTYDEEEGYILSFTGRSLESMLDRRIIWGKKTVSGNLQNIIKNLLDETIINPSDQNRKIDNFIFEESTDESITSLTYNKEYDCDNLYDVIKEICDDAEIGFKIILKDKTFVFSLYRGINRSYDQEIVPCVIFSREYENLPESNYVESLSSYKNVVLVKSGDDNSRKYKTVGEGTGLERREMVTDCNSSDNNVSEDILMEQSGKTALIENSEIVAFEGPANMDGNFKYGIDFFMGDIVHVSNDYGSEGASRMIELVISEDESGLIMYPTFKSI